VLAVEGQPLSSIGAKWMAPLAFVAWVGGGVVLIAVAHTAAMAMYNRLDLTRSERKPTPSGMGVSDSMARRSTADGYLHPQRLIYRKPHREVRKTAKIWQLGWGLPAGRKATTLSPRGRPRGLRGQSKSNPAPAWDGPPHRVAARRVDGPACGLGRTEGLRSLEVDTAREGEHARPHSGPNQSPANRSTRQGKFATGCGITGMPTACGIPLLKPE